jgi:hypothetical protein
MKNSSIFIIAILVLIFLGIMHSRMYQTTTTTSKTVVVKTQPQQPQKYGYKPPPAYNPYKAQYY